MIAHGTLIKWNDDRGFGFVALPQSREEIFVHISAFPKDGVRPQVGETISFEIRTAPDGRKRAERVERPAARQPRRQPPRRRPEAARRSPLDSLAAVAALLAIGFAAYGAYTKVRRDVGPVPGVSRAVGVGAQQSFRCDGRTRCSQMSSCAEARFFLAQCPGVQMDGDGDPCEQQWCN